MQVAFPIVLDGFSLSFTYAIMAIGLTLIFGVLRVLNFAHGELLMIGAYTVWVVFQVSLPFPVGLIAATALVAGIAIAMEYGLFKPTRKDPFAGFILSLSLVYIMQVTALLIFGPIDKSVPMAIPGSTQFLGVSVSIQKIVMIPVTAAIVGAVWAFLERTKYGRAVRACIQDSQAAALLGISRDKLSVLIMAMGGGLAGLAGGIISQTAAVTTYFGAGLIIKAFIVTIIGGVGSVGGTVVAALLFGFMDSVIQHLYNPRLIILVDVVVLLIILSFRPKGFFGRD